MGLKKRDCSFYIIVLMLLPGAREKSMCYVFSICFRVSCGYFLGLAGRNVEFIFSRHFDGSFFTIIHLISLRALINSKGELRRFVGATNCRHEMVEIVTFLSREVEQS